MIIKTWYNWVQIDHTKMEPLKDPRIDGNEPPAEPPEKTYVEPTQDSFPFD